MAHVRTALISVADKTGLPEFADRLGALGIDMLATGGTARLLREGGLEVTDVSDYTGFPEILDGGLRALHPKVTGGVLVRREEEEDLRELEELGIRTIDMVVVNLLPFVDVISGPGRELMRAVEDIDIAGPTLIRSAAKNYTHVAVVTNPASYEGVAEELEQNDAHLTEETHFRLALGAFRHTAHYDTAISRHLAGIHGEEGTSLEQLILEFVRKRDLAFGENPHQSAAFYTERRVEECSASATEQILGPKPSLAHVLDLNAGIELGKEFDRPATLLLLRGNPCGAALASALSRSCRKAFAGAPPDLAGLAVVLNRGLDVATAEVLASRAHTPGLLAAPGFNSDALAGLRSNAEWGAGMRVFQAPPLAWCSVDERAKDMKRVVGGLLLQDRDLLGFTPERIETVTEKKATQQQMQDIEVAFLCCKHSRSAAAVIAHNEAVLGVGSGQRSALEALHAARRHVAEMPPSAVLAIDVEDGPEVIRRAAEAGIECILGPKTSGESEAAAGAADRLGLALLLTPTRHLRC